MKPRTGFGQPDAGGGVRRFPETAFPTIAINRTASPSKVWKVAVSSRNT